MKDSDLNQANQLLVTPGESDERWISKIETLKNDSKLRAMEECIRRLEEQRRR